MTHEVRSGESLAPPKQAGREAGGPLRVSVARSVEEASNVTAAIVELRSRLKESSPNADPVRLLAEVRSDHGASSPYFALLLNGTEPVAAIVAVQRARRVECRLGYLFLRTPRLRCLDVVHGGVMATCAAGLDGAIKHLAGELASGAFQHVFVNRIGVGTPAGDALTRWSGRLVRSVVSLDPHWHVELNNGKDHKVPVSSKARYNRRREERLLGEHLGGQLSCVVVTDRDGVPSLLRAADQITRSSYHGSLGVGVRNSALWKAISEAMVEGGHLRAYVLMHADRPIAYIYGAVYSGVYTLEAMGFDPQHSAHAAGAVLLWKTMCDLADAKIDTVDFGFGDAEYKRAYGTRSFQDASIRIYGGGAAAITTFGADLIVSHASRAAIGVLQRAGSLKRLKRGWKRLLSKQGTKDQRA